MQLEPPKSLYCSNHSSYSSLCVRQRSSCSLSPSPTWLVHTRQPTAIHHTSKSWKYRWAGPKLQCSSSWLSKSMQPELPKLHYCSFVCPCVQIGLSLSRDFVRRQHPTCWNYCQHKLSRAKLAMQVMLTFKVNAIGTAKTFVLLQSQ
jgi:hypothetical protein